MVPQIKGFTLIELVVTVFIVGVLAAVAAPSFQSLIVGTRLSGEMNALIGALNVARSEAQKRGQDRDPCAAGYAADVRYQFDQRKSLDLRHHNNPNNFS